jgi:hypothetical protein
MTNGRRRSAGRASSLIQLDRNPEINQRARAHRPPPAALPDVFGTLELDGAIIGSRLADRIRIGVIESDEERDEINPPNVENHVAMALTRCPVPIDPSSIRFRVLLLRHRSIGRRANESALRAIG